MHNKDSFILVNLENKQVIFAQGENEMILVNFECTLQSSSELHGVLKHSDLFFTLQTPIPIYDNPTHSFEHQSTQPIQSPIHWEQLEHHQSHTSL